MKKAFLIRYTYYGSWQYVLVYAKNEDDAIEKAQEDAYGTDGHSASEFINCTI